MSAFKLSANLEKWMVDLLAYCCNHYPKYLSVQTKWTLPVYLHWYTHDWRV